ncbi:MAG: flagellar biosynthesis regulator FlaF [Smithella sp.]
MMNKDKLAEYARIQRINSTPREIEAEALTLGAHKLIHCRDNWGSEERKKQLAEALKFNQKLWTIFQANLSSAKNLLPDSLKMNLLKLSLYVDKQIFQIMAYPSQDKLTPIIDINLSLAEGLRKKPVPPDKHHKT